MNETSVRPPKLLPEHPVRVALLDLLAASGTVTSTQAAQRLGYSSGLCSFHLRQLARHGLIEEAPNSDGRARPWRLCWGPLAEPETPDFEVVVHVTPAEHAELTAAIRRLVEKYERRSKRPAGAEPVSVEVRASSRQATRSGRKSR